MLCNLAFSVPTSKDDLATRKDTHPADTHAGNLRGLPYPLLQVTEKEDPDAVWSFPIGSSDG